MRSLFPMLSSPLLSMFNFPVPWSRSLLSVCILLLLIFETLEASDAPPKLSGKRPNILLVISDDQSYPHASAYGDKAIHTPAFDRIAKEGILFRQAFVASPGCSPSRAAMLTGLQCWQLEEAGVHASSFPKKFSVFPDLLEQAGYFVGYTGKGWGPGDYEASGRSRNPAGTAFLMHSQAAPEEISSVDYAANFQEFLQQRPEGKPFFFWLGTHEPHRSYKAGAGKAAGMDMQAMKVPPFLPDVEEVRSDLLDYGYEIQWFDQQLEKTLKILEATGELDNTLIVVTSDNGMPFPRAKANVYEYGIHVPMALRWGQEVAGNRESEQLVSLMDLFATFLEVADAPFPAYKVESKSLLPLLAHPQKRTTHRSAIYASRERHSYARWSNLGYPQRCIRTEQYLYIRNYAPERWPAGAPQKYDASGSLEDNHTAYHDIDEAPGQFVIRQRNNPAYKQYFDWAVAKRPAEELYDIRNDPGCIHNLAEHADNVEELLSLRNQMGGYLMQTQDPRVTGNGDVFDTYPRLQGVMRKFPAPASQSHE